MSSAGVAVQAPVIVHSHLKGAECEANLLQVQQTCTQHTHTHEAALELMSKQHTPFLWQMVMPRTHVGSHARKDTDDMPTTLAAEWQIITNTGSNKRGTRQRNVKQLALINKKGRNDKKQNKNKIM